MAACGPDIVSIDGSVDFKDAVSRVGEGFAFQVQQLDQTRVFESCLAAVSAL